MMKDSRRRRLWGYKMTVGWGHISRVVQNLVPGKFLGALFRTRAYSAHTPLAAGKGLAARTRELHPWALWSSSFGRSGLAPPCLTTFSLPPDVPAPNQYTPALIGHHAPSVLAPRAFVCHCRSVAMVIVRRGGRKFGDSKPCI